METQEELRFTLKELRSAVFSAVMNHFGFDESDTYDQLDASELTDRILRHLHLNAETPT